ncbi:MAG: SpoIIE family protein phosphatase [Oscillospiraceae bacterium]|nr:SpoIIE family protein phosphatase [Oscillospiraceae bacterium]
MRSKNAPHSIFTENEQEANRYAARCMRVMSLVALAAWLMNIVGFFIVPPKAMNAGMGLCIFFFLLPTAVCRWMSTEKRWVKYFFILCCVLGITIASVAIPKHTILVWAAPIILSCHYYSKELTASTLAASVVCLILSGIAGMFVGEGDPNLMGAFPTSEAILTPALFRKAVLFFLLPRSGILLGMSFICATVASRTHELLEKQSHDAFVRQRMETELSVASSIQSSMLPSHFPAHPEFDIFASMTPAKEVGGDFYDFYLLDDDHLCITVADVSDKGVGAALFMSRCMTLLKTQMLSLRRPHLVMAAVNDELCQNNDEMFVTAWLGVLELSTGKLEFANAGHERPLLRSGGVFHYLEQKPGFVLGGLEGIVYEPHSLTLQKGDAIFQYTDGVTEAGEETYFGTARLQETLNQNAALSPRELLPAVEQAVYAFTAHGERSDDITMLCLAYQGGKNMNELNVLAVLDNLELVMGFVEEKLEHYGCPPAPQMQVALAVEEIFVNIANYAYSPDVGPASIEVEVHEEPLEVVITFMDKGKPYDPLAAHDPDITLPLNERAEGGLGIFLVKKTMDDVQYEYKDGRNILRIIKRL